jgi:hypothetical protein
LAARGRLWQTIGGILVRLNQFCLAVLGFCLSAGVAGAGSFSFTGTFFQDDQLEVFLFTAPAGGAVVRTWSYAGGTNAQATLIPPGGFDPVLSVFDATGGLVASSPFVDSNNDGAGVAQDPATHNAFDSLLTLVNPGTYALVLSQDDNFAIQPTYGDGFSRSGQGNFTAGAFGCLGSAPFCDSTPAQRNGNWAVDITGASTAQDITSSGAAPEPGSILLVATAIIGLALIRRRKEQA